MLGEAARVHTASIKQATMSFRSRCHRGGAKGCARVSANPFGRSRPHQTRGTKTTACCKPSNTQAIMGHVVYWYHTHLPCGLPWVQSPELSILRAALDRQGGEACHAKKQARERQSVIILNAGTSVHQSKFTERDTPERISKDDRKVAQQPE